MYKKLLTAKQKANQQQNDDGLRHYIDPDEVDKIIEQQTKLTRMKEDYDVK